MHADTRSHVPDTRSRDLIVSDLDRSLLVEAGAGSGKTQKLAERMAAGIATGTYELERMAAVTFTRKAAAELRGRFQAALEADRANGGPADRLARIDDALGNLERFFAGTIHAFCARLLHERPVEAGVSPGFTELDDVEDALIRRRSWRDYRAQARAIGDSDVMELIDAGITARQLDKAFETVCLYEDVTFPAGDAAMPDIAQACKALEQYRTALEGLAPSVIPPDVKCKTLKDRLPRFQRAWRAYARGRREPAFVVNLLRTWESSPDVTLKWWPGDNGKKAKQLHADFRDATVLPYLTAWRQYLYGRCVSLLVKARDAARAERRRRNALSFNDLLMLTAQVLRTNADVRHALQQKYRWLLVDEFQDTDPVQAEIMFLLAAQEETGSPSPFTGDPTEETGSPSPFTGDPVSYPPDWRTVSLRPGALFVVGDPKQSIYRFRRADIEIYNEVRTRLAGADGEGVLRLTTNFRSVPGLCDWANQVFSQTFPAAATAHSPMFAPLEPYREPATHAPATAVIDLADVAEAGDVATEEATRIARYIRAEVDANRRGFGDFLILTRKKKSLRPYAKALEALEVPIEVTGAGAFDESEEVRELALLLGALADPQDAVSLVGVLRGPLFGLSDEQLFAFRQAGGYFNLFAEIQSADAEAVRVAGALQSLRQWHKWTRTLPAGSALERILEDSGYLALSATSRGGVEAGDLLHAVDRVRAVIETGFTLAEAADALASWCGLDEDGPDESTEVDSLPLEPGRRDVVRLMNLHKAKGLEAEVVFLVDPLGGFEPRVDVRILREGAEPVGYFQIQEEGSGYARKVLAEPAGWDAHKVAEQAFLEAEVDRLMYVAATRAKDTLVVGRWPGKPGNRKPSWRLTASLATAPVLQIPPAAAPPSPPPVDLSASAAAQALAARDAAHDLSRRPSWATTSVTAEVKRLPRFTIQVEDDDDATRTIVPDTASHRADAGQAWGTLVHGLLEHAMRHAGATRDDLRRLALWLTVDEPQLRPVIDRAVETALAVVASGELASARAAVESQAEVPFAIQEMRDGVPTVVTGAIDLVHRT
ncbi:MAG: UvrD-helicase domain-containing protein, partial [Acidobacteriota bacterium]